MSLFHCSLASPTSFSVAYHTPNPPLIPFHPAQSQIVEIPFTPAIEGLERIEIAMHTSPHYPAYKLPDDINSWFSSCFGFPVILAYMGDGLGIPITPSNPSAGSWLSSLEGKLASPSSSINFSDTGALLVTTESSLNAVSALLTSQPAVLEKFRPNIVLDGESAWDEDFWSELTISPSFSSQALKVFLTSNCARCTSINVDLSKGRMGEDESGSLLKKMMKGRRVDKGQKWEPIFGRYGFPAQGGEIRVGDNVEVSGRMGERSVWSGFPLSYEALLSTCAINGRNPLPLRGRCNRSTDRLYITDGVMPRLTEFPTATQVASS
jgi:uncharacterized protein YcbX